MKNRGHVPGTCPHFSEKFPGEGAWATSNNAEIIEEDDVITWEMI